MRLRGWKLVVISLALPACMLLILATFFMNPDRIAAALARVSADYLVASILSQLTAMLLVGVALHLASRRRMELGDLLALHCAGYTLASITPGKVGYMAVSMLASDPPLLLSAMLVIQAVTVAVRVVALLGLASYISSYASLMPTLTFNIALAVAAAVFILVLMSDRAWLLVDHYLPSRLEGLARRLRESLVSSVRSCRLAVLLVFLSWPFTALRWYLIFRSMSLKVDPLLVVLLHPVLYVTAFMPVSPGGLGVTEAVGSMLQPLLGVSREAIFTSILLDRLAEIAPSFPFLALLPLRFEVRVKDVVRIATLLQRGEECR